jgi:hypothetical protein
MTSPNKPIETTASRRTIQLCMSQPVNAQRRALKLAEANLTLVRGGRYLTAMRIWTVHPRYLDPKGLVAAWREALLAQTGAARAG